MSGVATPPVITTPFGAEAVNITNPIPVEESPTPGLASYETGFTPINMTPGGIPPSGADFNGILFALSSWCAMLQAGQGAAWDEDVATAIEGYAVGAVLRDGLYTWTNVLDGNEDDPGDDPENWVRSAPLYDTYVAPGGTVNNLVLPGASDYVLNVDTTTGATDITGFVARRDGQKLYIINGGANLLRLLALTSSGANNQIRLSANLGIIQNQSVGLIYSTGAGKWLAI